MNFYFVAIVERINDKIKENHEQKRISIIQIQHVIRV